MELSGAVVVVTGAAGGLGRATVQAFLDAGAARVYAAARTAAGANALRRDIPGAVTCVCDVTCPEDVEQLAAGCGDVTVLVNNAGVNHHAPAIGSDHGSALAAEEIAVNYLGMLRVSRALAPALVANRPSALMNVTSILSRVSHPAMATYSASKAATGSLTQALRAQLGPQGVLVVSFMPAGIDTAMSAPLEIPKTSAAAAAHAIVEAIRDGAHDVYPDDMSAGLAAALAADHKAVEAQLAPLAPPPSPPPIARQDRAEGDLRVLGPQTVE